MKARRITDLFLQLDLLHRRVDFQRPFAHGIALCVALGWSVAGGANDIHALWQRFLACALFVMITRVLLSRLGASRLSSILFVATLVVLGANLTAAELMVTTVYALVMLLAQEYFLVRTKFMALAVAVVAGVLTAPTGPYGRSLVLLFVLVLACRVMWHALIERISKKAFVLFAIKAAAMIVVMPGVYFVMHRVAPFTYKLPALPAVHVPLWLLALVGVLVLRGLWATMLLRTARSPYLRAMRLFYVLFGAGLLVLVWIITHYGDRIFLPGMMHTFATFGLTSMSSMACYGIFAAGLLVTSGIDRTLYKDTPLARRLGGLLSDRTPSE